MANYSEYICWLDINQQKIGWIALHEKIRQYLKQKWNGNLHSLTFESGITGYFFVDNDVFHFEICQNRIEFNIIARSRLESEKLSEKFKTVIGLLFT